MVRGYCSNHPTTLFYSQRVNIFDRQQVMIVRYCSNQVTTPFYSQPVHIFDRQLVMVGRYCSNYLTIPFYSQPVQIFDRQYDYSEDRDANQPTIGLQCRPRCESTDNTISQPATESYQTVTPYHSVWVLQNRMGYRVPRPRVDLQWDSDLFVINKCDKDES